MKIWLKKPSITLLLMTCAPSAFADSIRLPDGTSCSFDSYNTPWEFTVGTSVRGTDNDYEKLQNDIRNGRPNSQMDDFNIKGEIKYKFGGPDRIDCSRLYELQLRVKEAELKDMELKLQKLRDATNIEWD